MNLFNILKEAKSPTKNEMLSTKILLEARKKAEKIKVPESDEDYTEGAEDDIDTGEEGTPEEDDDPQAESEDEEDYTEGVDEDEEDIDQDDEEAGTEEAEDKDGPDNGEIDYTEGAEDEDEPGDMGTDTQNNMYKTGDAEDAGAESDTGEPEGDSGEYDGDDGSGEEDGSDIDSGGDIDFTAGAEDNDGDGTDDTDGGSNGGEGSEGEEGSDGDYESDSSEDGSDEDPEEVTAKTKNKLLLNDCIYLYNGVKASMDKLNEFSDTNILKNKVIIQVKKNFSELLETLFTFITQSFFLNTYVKNLYNYNYFIEAYKINVQLLKKIEVFTANK